MGRKKHKSEHWDEMYELAKKYYEENGNLSIQTSYIADDGKKLGRFIENMKKAYRGLKGFSISQEQIKMLEEIGMEWNGMV